MIALIVYCQHCLKEWEAHINEEEKLICPSCKKETVINLAEDDE